MTAPRMLGIALLLTLPHAAHAAAPIVDGALDAIYGTAIAGQAIQTQVGDAGLGTVDAADGSELDAFYAVGEDSVLYLFLAGNLQSDFSRLELFFDTKNGGQNVLRFDNSNVDGNALNTMAGLTFDAGFEPDFWIGMGGGGAPYHLDVHWAELPTGGGGQGAYMGQTGAASDGVLTGSGANPGDLRATIDNRNTAGVNGGCAFSISGIVDTGIELRLRLPLIGYAGAGDIKVCAFVNRTDHAFLSNQMLGPLPHGNCNLGAPAGVNLATITGDQVVIVNEGVPARPASWGSVKIRYR
jgi:hypothetical protein